MTDPRGQGTSHAEPQQAHSHHASGPGQASVADRPGHAAQHEHHEAAAAHDRMGGHAAAATNGVATADGHRGHTHHGHTGEEHGDHAGHFRRLFWIMLALAIPTVAVSGMFATVLGWAAGYNLLSVPLAAGVLAPVGFVLPMAVGAILMSLSTIVVALNAQLLRRLDLRPEATARAILHQ